MAGLKSGKLRSGLRNVGTTHTIPNSAIHQWKYDEGTGTAAADSIGSNDGTISGANWSSSFDLVGGYGLSFDATDDDVDMSTVSAVGDGDAFSFAATINADDQTAQAIWQHIAASGDRTVLVIEDNNWQAGIFDGSTWQTREVSGGAETSRVRVCVAYDDPNTTYDIYIDATQSDDGDPGTISTSATTTGHRIGRRTDGNAPFGGVIDNPVIYDEYLSASQVQDDYDAQPWT